MVELLVVITIIGILISLLLPAVQAARESARVLQCQNNLKQLALAIHNYHAQNSAFPPAVQCPASEEPGKSRHMGANWCIAILPFMEMHGLYDQFDLTKTITGDTATSPKNYIARGTTLAAMTCPSDSAKRTPFAGYSTEGDNWARGNYAANGCGGYLSTWYSSDWWRDSRTRGVMGVNQSVEIAQITDGTSCTMLLGEIRVGLSEMDRRGTWALGGAGSSAIFAAGLDDDIGPNCAIDSSDNIANCQRLRVLLGQGYMFQERMSCYYGSGDSSDQATARSCHKDGVNIALCDGSVRFVSDFINVIGPNVADHALHWPTMSVWDRLIASGDGYVLSDGDF